MTKRKDPKEHKKVGRPPKIDNATLAKLEHGFKIGLTDRECCAYADIDPVTLYRYQDKNPEFCKQKEAWKLNPIAKAKYTIYASLDDPKTAQWYLERKCKDEFSTKVEQDIKTSGITVSINRKAVEVERN